MYSVLTEANSTVQLLARVRFRLILRQTLARYGRPYYDCEMKNNNKSSVPLL